MFRPTFATPHHLPADRTRRRRPSDVAAGSPPAIESGTSAVKRPRLLTESSEDGDNYDDMDWSSQGHVSQLLNQKITCEIHYLICIQNNLKSICNVCEILINSGITMCEKNTARKKMVFCWCVDVKCCLEEWKDLYKRCAEDWNVKTKFRGKFQIGRRNFTENSRNKQSRIQLITQCHDKVLRINQQKEKKSTFAWSTQNGWQNVIDKSVYDAKISRQNSMENTEYWDKNNILKF